MKFAIKSIPREILTADNKDLKAVSSELKILLRLDHPNIVKFFEVYLDHEYLHIVMELFEAADLDQILF